MNLERKTKFKILFLTILFLALFSWAESSQAANWYVRPSGGSGSGASWTAAWNGMSGINWSSVSCGDTIWIAGGTYGSTLSPQKVCSSGSQLYIRRARGDAPACTSAAGWSSGFDSTVQMSGDSGIAFDYANSYVTISGRTISSGGSNGWKISSSDTASSGIWVAAAVNTYITIEYMDLQGPGHVTLTGSSRGVDDTPLPPTSPRNSNHTFSHVNIWGWGNGIILGGVDNFIFEYGEIHDIYPTNSDVVHPNGIYIIDAANGIYRYSRYYDSDGEGIVFSDGGPFDNWKIYGNVFYGNNLGYSKALEVQEAAIIGLKIFNNTFYNNWSNFYLSAASCGSGCETRNNLIFGTGDSVACGTSSNNLSASSDPFVNKSSDDYHITSAIGASYPRNAGTNLAAYFTKDLDGTTFGGDGTWDIGAYEYSAGGGDITSPAAPSGLSVS